MNKSLPALRRLDLSTLEMILAVALISLHDFILSNVLSLPLALQNSPLVQVRAADRVMSGLEYVVPLVVFAVMIILWLMQRNDRVRTLAILRSVASSREKEIQTRMPQILRISQIFLAFRGIRSIRAIRVRNYHINFTTTPDVNKPLARTADA